MTAIREEGKINEDTTLIDIKMFGVPKISAIYLIESGKKCLIDAGTHTEARKILRQLKELDAFPPDMIVLTHSHWDHCQAIPFLNQRAKKEGKEIEIYASAEAIPNLRDQSYNEVFGTGPFNNIEADIKPLKDGDTVDLDGITLKIFELKGHMTDQIAILDEKNKNLFVGDALGDKVSEVIFVPPFYPPYWDKDSFLNSIDKIRMIDYKTMSITHFGLIYGDEARSILDESIANLNKWWSFFEANIKNLDDIPYMINEVLPKVIPKSELEKYPLKLKEAIAFWLSEGFKISKGI
jgi:glyoxylase-like metal-dependent hydrolase (beta-lactamase superfamily II)